LYGKEHHCPVAPTFPCALIWGADQSIHFGRRKKGYDRLLEVLLGNGKNLLDKGSVFWMTQSGVAEQGADRTETCVTGPGAVLTIRLQMVEEGADDDGVEIVECKVGGRLAALTLDKAD
jgi:hypothetical protein